MPPGSEEVLSAVSPLVACCPTFEAASITVEFLCSRGVSRDALSVVVDGVRPAAGAGTARRTRSELMTSRRYYVMSDQRSARKARQLLATGADAQGETFGVHAVPCVGQLPSKSLHPSNGVSRTHWWLRRMRPHWEKS